MIGKPSILYVEDDPSLAYVTGYNLEEKGYHVMHCKDGNKALEIFSANEVSLCLLDIMLPGLDGLSLARRIRDFDKDVPIIFLTAKSLLEDKISGFSLGADDYISKPFQLEELLLKIAVFLRRPQVKEFRQNILNIGNLMFDFDNLRLYNEKKTYQMTLKEARLLRYLFERQNTVVKREVILKAIWGDDDYFLGRSLDVFISRLRKYLGGEQKIKIENVHSVGFKLCVH